MKVLDVAGHTNTHLAYYIPPKKDSVDGNIKASLFCGDTLFALGCGRVFEGTMEQMWNSLKTLRALPSKAKIYCGHEYTLSNAKFAISIDPDNLKLKKRIRKFEEMRWLGTGLVRTMCLS